MPTTDRTELERVWAITARHLNNARQLLRDEAPPGADGATLAGFEECLRDHEMVSALEELEDLGLTNAPPAEFWRHLMYAAESMALGDRATEFKRRMQRA